MKNLIITIASLALLTACGGSSSIQTYEQLDADANALYNEVTKRRTSTIFEVDRNIRGGARYEGTAYGALTGDQIGEREYFRSKIVINASLDPRRTGDAITGSITNFVTDDEMQLGGALTIAGTIPRSTSYVPISGTISGNLLSPGTGEMEQVDAIIRGAFYGVGAQYIGGNIADYSGPLRVNGGFVVER